MPYLAANVSVMDYGADPTGATDSTSAFNQALAAVAAAGGGVVSVPAGTFTITPSGSPAVGISFMGTGSQGYQGVRLVGAGFGATILSKAAAGVAVQLSGPSTSPSTGATHTRYCSLESLQILGGNFTGAAIQAYYVDNLLMREVFVENNADIGMDCAEFWDSRIINCIFGGTGSTTANASAPNLYLRNSAAASGFGNSAGTTNDIVVDACRFEAFLTGAVWVAQGTGSSSGPNTILITNCKMETSQVNGGPHLLVDANTRAAYVDMLYCYSGGFTGGYSTAQNVVTWSGQDSSLNNVFIANGTPATVANGVSLNSTVSGQNAVARNVTGIYTTAPTGLHVAIGTSTGGCVVDNCHSNQTDPSILNQVSEWIAPSSSTNMIGTSVGTDTVHRWTVNANGASSWGSGAAAADVVQGRVTTSVLGLTTGSYLIGGSDLGDGSVGSLKMANATTTPTANPTGGGVRYVVAGVPWWRDPNGVVSTEISPSEFSASPTGALGESLPRIAVNSAAQAIGANTGTVYMVSLWLPAGLKVSNISWVTGTTAAGTPTHWWLGLANSSGLQLAHTADQTSTAIAASSLVTKALTAAFTTTYTGTHYILLSVTATTNPTASGIAAPTTMSVTSPLLAGVSTSAAQTAPGTDGTTSYTLPSAAGAIPYMYLT